MLTLRLTQTTIDVDQYRIDVALEGDGRPRQTASTELVFRLSPQEQEVLRDKQAYKMLSKWTSARHPQIIVAIEDEYNMEIGERDIPRLSTLQKIVDYLEDHV